MKAYKYPVIDKLPNNAVKVSIYAESIGQKNPPYICVMYDRYLNDPTKYAKPPFIIVNWQNSNFVIPD
jgi:hypothetical protein